MIARENLLLGTMCVTGLPLEPKGKVGARVTFMYDINGILDIQIVSGDQSLHKVIMNKKIGLGQKELEARLEELRKMTLSSVEDENVRYLLERANRLYQECTPSVREYLAVQISRFRQILSRESNARARREVCVQLAVYLEAVERNKFDFDGFDEAFFEDDCGDGEENV